MKDPAFLDRVDIKQHVPSPSSAAVYNIFRSCINELMRSRLLAAETAATSCNKPEVSQTSKWSPPQSAQRSQSPYLTRKRRRRAATTRTPSPTTQPTPSSQLIVASSPAEENSPANSDDIDNEQQTIPTLPTTLMTQYQDPSSLGQRIWILAQKCQDLQFSGRTLRRLPVLGLAMYTWGGRVDMSEAVGALERAVEEEIFAMRGGKVDGKE